MVGPLPDGTSFQLDLVRMLNGRHGCIPVFMRVLLVLAEVYPGYL